MVDQHLNSNSLLDGIHLQNQFIMFDFVQAYNKKKLVCSFQVKLNQFLFVEQVKKIINRFLIFLENNLFNKLLIFQ